MGRFYALQSRLILHWFRPKLISEPIKCGGGVKIWFQGWLHEKKASLNSSTFWVFEPVFKYVLSKSSFFVQKASILISQHIEKKAYYLTFNNKDKVIDSFSFGHKYQFFFVLFLLFSIRIFFKFNFTIQIHGEQSFQNHL